MKQFFKFMFASLLGTIIAGLFLFFLFIGIVASLATIMEPQETKVNDNSILVMKLNYPILDRTTSNPFATMDPFSFESLNSLGLNDILKNIQKAAKDEKIKGIYLNLSSVDAGLATIDEIRNEILEFKKSGKFVLAYGETYSQGAYYLASSADKIYLPPEGLIEFKGLSAELMFFKGLIEKLDVDMQIIRHGKFKSAVEPFMLDKMSPENREQITTMVNGMWNHVVGKISESRGITAENLNKIADTLMFRKAAEVVALGLADSVFYYDQVVNELKSRTGKGIDDKLELVTIEKYTHARDVNKEKVDNQNRIALIYGVGDIGSGKGDEATIGSETLAKAIHDARTDKKVKAIVLRVNSPGGSMLASDVILREARLAADAKPFIVSFGDVAASGGYYISCFADTILANEATLTGSIGVFGLLPNAGTTFKNKLGITFDYANTNQNSDFPSLVKPLSPFQLKMMQNEVDVSYGTFTKLVADGRGIPVEKVDEIGQGRVWTGTDGKKLGLVDEFGGLNKAIEIAASAAKIDSYRIVEYPKFKDPFTAILDELSGQDSEETFLRSKLGPLYESYRMLMTLQETRSVQARLPYNIVIR